MRLHRLEVTAFGPFADTATVDFDALSAAGLFLLSGATGAGKSSVLDAVCFALYGAVPGDRNDAKRLRSDQADGDVAPSVVLDVTLSGRRFRIARSPAWSRPKKRGSGRTPQQASVVVSEHTGGSWVPLSTRLDEAGQLVTGLVGMTLTQFTQVAMLPQGRFQAFLRASSEERHRVLQHLFRTERFEQVEAWLRDRRLTLHRASLDHERRVSALVHRFSETAEATTPSGDASPLGWSTDLAEAAADLAGSLQDELAALREAECASREALEAGRVLAERHRRRATALAEQARLAARSDEIARIRLQVAEARRAQSVVPVHLVAAGAAHACAELRRRVARHESVVAETLGVDAAQLAPDTLPRLLADATDEAAAARALLPRERERVDLATRLATARGARGDRDLAELREQAREARAAVARVESARRARDEAGSRLEACRALHAVRNELVAAQLDLNQVVAARLSLVEELLAMQQARIDGMAAEMAGRLAAGGGSCPVCGSDHHPHLAAAAPGAPDAAAERALRKQLDDAEIEELARATHARDLETQAALALQAAGTDDEEELQQVLAEATRALTDTETAAAAADDLEAAAHRVAELDAAVASLDERLSTVTEELADALGDAHRDIATLVTHRETLAASLVDLRSAHTDLAAADRAHDDARAVLATTATQAGFRDVASAIAAALPDDQLDELLEVLETHERRSHAVEAVLAEPLVARAGTEAVPDLDALASSHEAAAAALSSAEAAHLREQERAARLTTLRQRLVSAVHAWEPVRAELELVSGLAAFVEGKSPDNQLQMRLSAYVLAYRLSQVVAAANTRLAVMSDRRYSLEHTGRRGAGERRGGLSLLVRDDWSGESRDPATLSGGETFVVSLALALGLADVIVNEVGGATLDTLFVDEGFGSLDADTLDDVMDTLDSLRDGGRVVGVVSHVAEMRDRIPTQLVVTKSRGGSSVRLRG